MNHCHLSAKSHPRLLRDDNTDGTESCSVPSVPSSTHGRRTRQICSARDQPSRPAHTCHENVMTRGASEAARPHTAAHPHRVQHRQPPARADDALGHTQAVCAPTTRSTPAVSAPRRADMRTWTAASGEPLRLLMRRFQLALRTRRAHTAQAAQDSCDDIRSREVFPTTAFRT